MTNVIGIIDWQSDGEKIPFVSRQIGCDGKVETNADQTIRTVIDLQADDTRDVTETDIGRIIIDSYRSVPVPYSGTEGPADCPTVVGHTSTLLNIPA